MTVEEQRAYMRERAREHYQEHKKAFDNWREGNIRKIWLDKNGNICIEYESGRWWHYNDKGQWW